jgi:hypothetical protein
MEQIYLCKTKLRQKKKKCTLLVGRWADSKRSTTLEFLIPQALIGISIEENA